MTDWPTFAGVAGVVLALLLGLARASEAQLSTPEPRARTREREHSRGPEDAPPAAVAHPGEYAGRGGLSAPERTGLAGRDPSAGALLANVAVSQGAFGVLLAAAAWWTEVPQASLGLDPVATPGLLAVGAGLGAVLWVANEVAGRVASRVGIDPATELRGALAPDSAGGWALLLFAVLPTVALFEEFLFRAVLVGALAAGFGVSPWLLAVGSSVAFALGHGAQGRVGVLATGAFGLLLAAAFVLTGSFLVVALAHYLVNAATFVVHEGLGVEW